MIRQGKHNPDTCSTQCGRTIILLFCSWGNRGPTWSSLLSGQSRSPGSRLLSVSLLRFTFIYLKGRGKERRERSCIACFSPQMSATAQKSIWVLQVVGRGSRNLGHLLYISRELDGVQSVQDWIWHSSITGQCWPFSLKLLVYTCAPPNQSPSHDSCLPLSANINPGSSGDGLRSWASVTHMAREAAVNIWRANQQMRACTLSLSNKHVFKKPCCFQSSSSGRTSK